MHVERQTKDGTGADLHSAPGYSSVLSHWAAAWVILLAALAATAGAWAITHNSVTLVARERFEGRTENLKAAVLNRMEQQADALRGGVGLFAALGNVDRQQWHSYVRKLDPEKNLPGLTGFGFSLQIRPENKAAVIRSVRAEGYPEFDIRPPGEREIYTSIIYLEPFSGRNLRAFGFDMFSEPTRREAMERARDTGDASVSGIVRLVQETDKDIQSGFLMYVPVYRGKGEPITTEERRERLIGYVYSPFRMRDLMDGVLGGSPDVNFEIYDGVAVKQSSLLYRSDPENAQVASEHSSTFTRTISLAVGGHAWTLNFRSHDDYISSVEVRQPRIIAASGIVIAFLLFFAVRSTSARQHRAERIAQWTTEELEAATVRTRSIVETVMDGLITIDEIGRIETINPAVERIFGYCAADMIGQNIKMLMPEPYHSEHDGYLAKYRSGGEANIIGRRREVSGRRKDGSTFPLELSVSEMRRGMERLFVGSVRDITERKQVERLKNEFVSVVSHELRTPLTSIRGSLGLITGGVMGEIPPKVTELVRIAYKNSERLTNLINDILDIEKIESGKMQFRLQPQKLMPLVEQAVEANQGYARGLGVEFQIVEEMSSLDVLVDADRLMQVITNLLSNAAKYSPMNGKVDVSVVCRGNSARISVRDYGPGMPFEFQRRVFQKFSQADSSESRAKSGTGLGLTISKAIVEHMGGQISFETDAGKGTVFHVDLPLWVKAPVVIGEEIAGSGARVLVCEDDPSVASLIKVINDESGLQADIAPDAATARRLLRERTYAAMTLDLALPDCDGLSLIRELRADARTYGLPIIVVSAAAEKGRALTKRGLGVVEWLSKPIDQDRLMAALNRALHPQGSHKPRVLHVEDDPDVCRVVSSIAGDVAEFDIAGSLQEARAKLQARHYQLLVLDVSLPDGTGWELVELLKGMADPPAVLVFSASEVETADATRVSGALVKSRTSNDELLVTLKRLLRGGSDIPPARAA